MCFVSVKYQSFNSPMEAIYIPSIPQNKLSKSKRLTLFGTRSIYNVLVVLKYYLKFVHSFTLLESGCETTATAQTIKI